MKNKPVCSYCGNQIQGYVETSKLDKNIKLCSSCYYAEMFSIAMAKIIKESEEEDETISRSYKNGGR